MKFENLKDKCEFYRSLSDTKLLPNAPVLIMLDGHCFSKVIKKNFKLPFDDTFITLMNKTAAHVCSKIQGAVFAYVQSDEISIFVKDYNTPDTDSYFGYRTCKLLSIIAAEATAFFNKEFIKLELEKKKEYSDKVDINEFRALIAELPEFTFDCKAWNVPNENEVFAWFLYRQNDCVRNSKQQFAQTHLSHKTLMGHLVDEQIQMVKDQFNLDWNDFNDGEKFGRLIYREPINYKKVINGVPIGYTRHEFLPHYAYNLNVHPDKLRELINGTPQCED